MPPEWCTALRISCASSSRVEPLENLVDSALIFGRLVLLENRYVKYRVV